MYHIAKNFGGQNLGEFAKNRFWWLKFWWIDAKADRHSHNHFILAVKILAKFAKILSTKMSHYTVWCQMASLGVSVSNTLKVGPDPKITSCISFILDYIVEFVNNNGDSQVEFRKTEWLLRYLSAKIGVLLHKGMQLINMNVWYDHTNHLCTQFKASVDFCELKLALS